jgi:Fe-S cluster biogenesis protein NfuA
MIPPAVLVKCPEPSTPQEKVGMGAPTDATALKERVARALALEVGPALAMDGTLIEVLDVTDGVARLRLGGVCSGCPSSLLAIIMGIEQELRRAVPEVDYVEAVG